MRASGLLHCWEFLLGAWSVGFNYLFTFPPSYFALWDSKAHHRPARESVSWCLETSLFLKTPFPGWISVPISFVSLFILYMLSYFLLKTMGCFSGCLMSSASIQKLFCGICLAFFQWICGGDSGLPVLFLCHLRTTHYLIYKWGVTHVYLWWIHFDIWQN